MDTNKIIVYPAVTMVTQLVDNGYEHDDITLELADFANGGYEGSVIDTYMHRMKESGETALDGYIQIWPIKEKNAVLFADKEFLLSVIESDSTHLDHVLNDIAFRSVAGTMSPDVEQTLVVDFQDHIFQSLSTCIISGVEVTIDAQSIHSMEINTLSDFSYCDYEDYFSTAISWPIVEAIEKIYGPLSSEGYTYVSTVDFIVEELKTRHKDVFLQKYSNARQIINDAYEKQMAAARLAADLKPETDVSTEFAKVFVFDEEGLNKASALLWIPDNLNLICKFVSLAEKGKEKFNNADMLILNVKKLTKEIDLTMKMLDFKVDDCAPNRYRLFHNNYQKLFVVVVDG